MIVRLPFLGRRHYLHGTTLFDALVDRCDARPPISFKLSRMMFTDRVSLGETAPTGESPVATFDFRGPTGDVERTQIFAADPSSQIERQPYDEHLVIDATRFDPARQRVSLVGAPPFSLIATLIPMKKALLRAVDPTHDTVQWLFVRVDLREIPSPANGISVEYAGSLFDSRIIRSRIYSAETEVGELYFSRARAEVG